MSSRSENPPSTEAKSCDKDTESFEEESRDQLSCIGVLPWHRGHSHSHNETNANVTEIINPGEFVLRALFTEFTVLAERKIERLLKETVEKPLSKSLQRGEDPQFDQLLSSLSSVAEHCLSSLLRTLFQWYERQTGKEVEEANRSRSPNRGWSSGPESPRPRLNIKEKDPLWERRDLAVEFIFCLVLIEVLKQLCVHPVEDSQIQYIENLAFKHFKDEESTRGQQSQVNRNIVTALYAEVIGVLAQTRFQSVRKRFMQEYKDSQGNSRVQVNVVMGLKFIRIKLYPVDELEESFLFLQELASLFLEKNLDKEVKYAFTSLFVEILIPVASVAKREYNIPAVKKFVDMLFKDALELARKAKHSLVMYPLVTALLCISQKQFFLANWGTFLNMCLSQIKSRDVKMHRMAMECLHRLIWVYVIRIKCENHASTLSRLRSVVDALFPKGSRTVTPRNIPLTIFVKIIQFIGQEKLDFAMQDVIFDLLNIGKGIKQLNPERMNIGLRAFLVIADNLQKKEGAPPMPGVIGALPSRTNNTLKVKKTFSKLTEEAARNIGVVNYFTNVRRALDTMLRTLDAQVGRPMTMINPQCMNKDVDDMITGERKAKIDLFRTCVAAIPKCIPDGMTKAELVELVSRLTLHMDEELKTLAFTNLQSLIMDFPDYREEVVLGYITFILREVPDTFPQILENTFRMLLQLLVQWRTAALTKSGEEKGGRYLEMSMQSGHQGEQQVTKNSEHVLHCVEGFALIMLCSTKAMLRKLSLSVLKETRVLLKCIHATLIDNTVVDTIEECSSAVIEKALCYVSGSDKSSLGLSPQMDLHLLAEKSALLAEKEHTVAGISRDLWAHCLAGFLDRIYTSSRHCSCIFQFSWPFVYTRLFNMYSLIDPSVDFDSITSRASAISFKAPKKTANLSDICLWRNYLIFVSSSPPKAALSRTTSMNSLQEMLQNETEVKFDPGRTLDTPKLNDVLKTTVLLIRSESHEIREAAVTGLGKIVPIAHAQLIEEMHQLIREVLDRKAEGVRKKRKRDLLRLQVVRVFAANADQGCFRHSLGANGDSGLMQCISEYVDGMRHIMDMDNDKDEPGLVQLRLYFSKFLHKMIKSIPLSVQTELLHNQLRHHLFLLLASWCGHFNVSNVGTSTRTVAHSAELEFSALEAMCALLCCGEVFDQKALEVANGYLYRLLDTMLISENNKVYSLGQETVELMLENNKKIPSLLKWVIDRCYTGKKGVSNGCFLALANVLSKRPYPCQLVSLLCVVLFKTGDSSPEIRERAAQLLYLLDRRFFGYMISFRSAFSSYSYGQQNFSQELAVTHPELTLPMLSEMTLRFETTSMVGQRCLLHFMLPWLGNIELVDVTSSSVTENTDSFEVADGKSILKPIILLGIGWGSADATQMILNNMFYLTVKYDEYFSKEIEACWAALSLRCEENNDLIFDYLIVMAGLCGTPVLPHAKKVAIYVARANTMKSVEELMEELKLTETVTTQWERSDSPPYFRPSQKVQTSPLENPPEPALEGSEQNSPIHIKHNSFDQENDSKSDSSSIGKRPSSSQRSSGSFGSAKTFAESVSKQNQIQGKSEEARKETGTGEIWAWQWSLRAHQVLDAGENGIPLPIPEDLKYFAPITLIFPMTIPPAHLYRCNFALVLLTEIVSDRPDVHWIIHLPLMLHVAFLGLDHMKPLVHEHCKRLLINLVVTLVCGGERSTVAKALMDFQSVSNIALDRSSGTRGSSLGITEEGFHPEGGETIAADATDLQRNSLSVSGKTINDGNMSLDDKAREMIEFLAKSDCKPLWTFEDITPRHCSIKSAEQLEAFLRMVLSLFEEAVPHALLLERWGREALHWATSCSSRHYAGRSFQVFRALHVPLTWTMLSDILQRLAESVAETSEDVQGYVLEILFTFLSEVDCARSDYPRQQIESLRHDTARRPSLQDLPNHERPSSPADKLAGSSPMTENVGSHNRSFSTDYHIGDAMRQRSGSDNISMLKRPKRYVSEMILSRANQSPVSNVPSLKEFSDFQQMPESPLDMFARLFWIAVSLFESDYEHEFVMAIKLLEKVLDAMDLNRAEALDRIEKLLNKLNWPNFPGVQSLLLKGLTSTVTAEPTLHLLSKLTVLTSVSIIDPSPVSGLSLNIVALLPRLIVKFDDPDDFCVEVAQSIAKACDKNKSLSNLGKVMTMYKDKEYSKSVQVWIECVCKYILDTFPHLSTTLLALLVEILEQGPPYFQQAVLNMICAILKYSDASSPGLKQFHNYLLKIVTAHVKDINLWKESLSILKLVVSNASQIHEPAPSNNNGIMSSALVQPRGSIGSLLSLGPTFRWGSNMGLADSSWALSSQLFKKELPGRTLEFTYNVAATPLIGAKFSHTANETIAEARNEAKAECTDVASPPSASGMVASNRKPHSSQRRTRERLVQLLPLCGHKGGLKQSLSVIFSSSSDLAVDSKPALSSEETSGDEQTLEKIDDSTFSKQKVHNVLTEFDFLYDELDNESEDMTNFDWTSASELPNDDPYGIGQVPSRSGSEPDLITAIKDDELTDEEDSDSLQISSSNALKEDDSREEPDMDKDKGDLSKESLDTLEGKEVLKDIVPEGVLVRNAPPTLQLSEDVVEDTLKVDRPEPSPNSVSSADSTLEALDRAQLVTSETVLCAPRYFVLSYEEIPYKWNTFVTSFVASSNTTAAADSLPCFPMVLKACGYWLQRLTRECCDQLEPGLEAIGSKFSEVEETLENELKLPYVFVDHELFQVSNLLTRHKFAAIKLNEGLQVLQEKREQAQEHLDLIQATKRGSSLDSDEDFGLQIYHQSSARDVVSTDTRVMLDLSTCLYRIHMQFVICLEVYLGYIEKIVTAAKKSEVHDFSQDLLHASKEISNCCDGLDTTGESHGHMSFHAPISAEGAIEDMVDHLKQKHFREALGILQAYRSQSWSDFIGRKDDELDTMVAIYARFLMSGRSRFLAVSGSVEHLSDLCDRLSEFMADLLSRICDMNDR